MPEEMNAASLQAQLEEVGASWQAGETSVSDLPEYEQQLRLGYYPGPEEPSLMEREAIAQAQLAAHAEAFGAIGAPAAYDLRNVAGRNFITSVKDQSSCGSCVAFGTAATVEGTLRVERNDANLAIDLSEAHLFYCHARAQGRNCDGPPNGGWWVPPALDCFKTPGVSDEACYPYVAGDQNCTNLCSNWQSRVIKITNWRRMTSPLEMKTWLSTKGPLSACFTVYGDFYLYRSGIYHHVSGELKGGHCICVVGYNDAQQFWICKNSWGPDWGESGFFNIRYGDVGIDAEMWGVEGVVSPSVVGRVPLYRYWNRNVTDHFYTTNWSELGSGRYGWNFESIQCYVFNGQQPGTLPLYRYWNPTIGDHFYTTNWAELGAGRYGWRYEGTQCYVRGSAQAGAVPLYRYWNPTVGDHFYTTNWGELGAGRYGWRYEGVQCYVYQQASGGAESTQGAAAGVAEPAAEVPSSFATEPAGLDSVTPESFSVASGGTSADETPGSFATETEDTSASFQVEEKKGRRIIVTIATDDGS